MHAPTQGLPAGGGMRAVGGTLQRPARRRPASTSQFAAPSQSPTLLNKPPTPPSPPQLQPAQGPHGGDGSSAGSQLTQRQQSSFSASTSAPSPPMLLPSMPPQRRPQLMPQHQQQQQQPTPVAPAASKAPHQQLAGAGTAVPSTLALPRQSPPPLPLAPTPLTPARKAKTGGREAAARRSARAARRRLARAQRARDAASVRRLQAQLLLCCGSSGDGLLGDGEGDVAGGGSAVGGMSLEEELVAERLLQLAEQRMRRQEACDLGDPVVAAQKLLGLAQELGADAALVASTVQRYSGEADAEDMLLIRPLEMQARMTLLGSVLQLPSASEVLQLSLRHPALLARASPALAKRLTELDALFKSRGLSLTTLARKEPNLLTRAPGTLRVRLDAIPAALDLPPRRARDIIARCPSLLLRSPATVHERYKLLARMFDSVPRNFLSELVTQEPRVLELSAATIAAKFAWLRSKYGSFQDDIVDMILVDPKVLTDAIPGTQHYQSGAAGAASSSSSSSGGGGGGSSRQASPGVTLQQQQQQQQQRLEPLQAPGAAAAGSGGEAMQRESGAASQQQKQKQRQHRGTRKAAATVAPTRPLSGLRVLLAASDELGLPLDQVAGLCLRPGSAELVRGWQAAGAGSAAASLSAVGEALELSTAEARELVKQETELLALARDQLRERASALTQLLQPPSDASVTPPDATAPMPNSSSSSSSSSSSPATASTAPALSPAAGSAPSRFTLLRQYTSLLLLDPPELRARLASLASELGGLPTAKLTRLLEVVPGLVLEAGAAPGEQQQQQQSQKQQQPQQQSVSDRLRALGALLGGVSSSLVVELVSKEPRLLKEEWAVLEGAYEGLASGFGSFREDALEVVLADPTLLLRKGGQVHGGAEGEAWGVEGRGEEGQGLEWQGARKGGGGDSRAERREKRGERRERREKGGKARERGGGGAGQGGVAAAANVSGVLPGVNPEGLMGGSSDGGAAMGGSQPRSPVAAEQEGKGKQRGKAGKFIGTGNGGNL